MGSLSLSLVVTSRCCFACLCLCLWFVRRRSNINSKLVRQRKNSRYSDQLPSTFMKIRQLKLAQSGKQRREKKKKKKKEKKEDTHTHTYTHKKEESKTTNQNNEPTNTKEYGEEENQSIKNKTTKRHCLHMSKRGGP